MKDNGNPSPIGIALCGLRIVLVVEERFRTDKSITGVTTLRLKKLINDNSFLSPYLEQS